MAGRLFLQAGSVFCRVLDRARRLASVPSVADPLVPGLASLERLSATDALILDRRSNGRQRPAVAEFIKPEGNGSDSRACREELPGDLQGWCLSGKEMCACVAFLMGIGATTFRLC